ncbi:MAG: hypothetical protein DCC51_15720 [Anaerolineae bacterium]|nr:MAG: hypothetical protein DCC51_15720 [Anaerolineae bacterium]
MATTRNGASMNDWIRFRALPCTGVTAVGVGVAGISVGIGLGFGVAVAVTTTGALVVEVATGAGDGERPHPTAVNPVAPRAITIAIRTACRLIIIYRVPPHRPRSIARGGMNPRAGRGKPALGPRATGRTVSGNGLKGKTSGLPPSGRVRDRMAVIHN